MDQIREESADVHFQAWMADDDLQVPQVQEKSFQRRRESRRHFGS